MLLLALKSLKWQKEAERLEPATLASLRAGLAAHRADGACGQKGRAGSWGAEPGHLESSGAAPTPAYLAWLTGAGGPLAEVSVTRALWPPGPSPCPDPGSDR